MLLFFPKFCFNKHFLTKQLAHCRQQSLNQGRIIFPKIWEPPQNSKLLSGEMKHIFYPGPVNVRRHYMKFSRLGSLAPRNCAPLVLNVAGIYYTKDRRMCPTWSVWFVRRKDFDWWNICVNVYNSLLTGGIYWIQIVALGFAQMLASFRAWCKSFWAGKECVLWKDSDVMSVFSLVWISLWPTFSPIGLLQ